ncbi:nitrous oxide reductase family maturation protein NosD [Sulfuritalea hydrogenivorans]|jgi:nitrous oxidase accessory protein|uniref:Nitrous oxidase accessory protein n=1 Tax=Sulfuritalea hydrogenivorans sk43H TaxID=1223802 RepID=W0SKI3_9PROT|nr:nitrous oxide reductase family maturation protein NosD [Sulfuritalea hydrogenivorans]BAO30343.1 nitrous oxidase accessory protein [Sulfuritalea hydrogenivorans sk43H]
MSVNIALRLGLSLCFGLALPALAMPPAALQPLIDATPAGGTLRLPPGSYAGPASITRPLTLEGGRQAVIVGDGKSTVLSVAANGVTLRGLRLTGSGDSHDRVDAGVLLEGDDHRVEDNELDDVLFGIHLKRVNRSRIANNRVTGKKLDQGMRGDAIRLWYSQHNVIEGNRFIRARDLTFANSADNRIVGNHFTDGRYGMHIIFSPRLLVENNRLSDTGTGIIVLYSPDLVLRGNHVAHALTGGGGGIVFKESNDALVENNEVLHCSVGLRVDAPPESVGKLTVKNNRFAHNIIGLFFYGEEGGHRFFDNRFENNLTTVAISAPGAGSANKWRGNYWDDYQGFDRNGDGIGDTPHEVYLFADRIWMETPMATFFRNSPVLEMLDFLERLAPFSTPHRVLQDPRPRMK